MTLGFSHRHLSKEGDNNSTCPHGILLKKNENISTLNLRSSQRQVIKKDCWIDVFHRSTWGRVTPRCWTQGGDPWAVFFNYLVLYQQGCEGTSCFLFAFLIPTYPIYHLLGSQRLGTQEPAQPTKPVIWSHAPGWKKKFPPFPLPCLAIWLWRALIRC